MKRAPILAVVLLAVHAGATAWVAASYVRSDNPWALLAVSALPLAQVSLLAAWGVLGGWPSFVRAAVAVIGVTALWAVECRSLNMDLSDYRCAGYAAALAVQGLLIGGLLGACRLGSWLFSGRHGSDGRETVRKTQPRRPVQFSVASVLGWITAVALILGAWKVAWSVSGWPAEVIKSEPLRFGIAVGAYHALVALVVFVAVAWGRRWHRLVAQGVLALAVVVGIAATQAIVLQTLFGTDGHVATEAWVGLAGFQALYLLASLVPMRLCRYAQGEESNHGTSTSLAADRAGLPHTA